MEPRPDAAPLWARAVVAAGAVYRRWLGFFFVLLGPRLAYAALALLARLMHGLADGLRQRGEANCAAVFGATCGRAETDRLARDAFVQRVLNLADLELAARHLHPGTCARYGGAIPEPHLANLRAAQARRQPMLLLSPYFGPYDLLPALLGLNGIAAAAVFRHHENADFDRRRTHVRARGGCELVPLADAARRVPQVLGAGGTVALIADHPGGRRDLRVQYLGRPATARREVGILAVQFAADVVVAGLRRVGPFRFRWEVADVFGAADWADAADPVRAITERYLRAYERIILTDPRQYLWAYDRWTLPQPSPDGAAQTP